MKAVIGFMGSLTKIESSTYQPVPFVGVLFALGAVVLVPAPAVGRTGATIVMRTVVLVTVLFTVVLFVSLDDVFSAILSRVTCT